MEIDKIKYALRLAKECTYADLMMDSAKEHLRGVIDTALEELKKEEPTEEELKTLAKKENKGYVYWSIVHIFAGIALGYLMCKYQ